MDNDVTVLLGLHGPIKLREITEENPDNPTLTYKALGATLSLVFKLAPLYYESPLPCFRHMSFHKFIKTLDVLLQYQRTVH